MKINYDNVLGEGSFANVYGTDNNQYVAKVEDNILTNLLKKEAKLMMKMCEYDKDGKYVIPIYKYYEEDDKNIMIMQRMGLSLADMVRRNDVTMDEYSIKNMMRKMIIALKFIHEFGFCHGDIKPENVMLSRDYKKIYFIDFGLSKAFMVGRKHIAYKENVSPSGTLRFMSVNVNDWIKMSRRDDLISLGYMIIYMQTRYLPWQNITSATKKDKYNKVAKIKRSTPPDKLVEDCLHSLKAPLIKYMRYVNNLRYDEKPDYDYLLAQFN